MVNKMMKYRGYYIDKNNAGCFNSKKEVDEFIKKETVTSFKKYTKLSIKYPMSFASDICMRLGKRLHDEFGYSYEEIEMFELEVMD